MKMIMIENDGEVDVLAFTLMGASTKRNTKGKIGFFGSGNKYAIANLLRRNIQFKIFAGEEEIKVHRHPVEYRGNNYEKISFEKAGVDHPTSITTSMGPKWEPWYIIRELYCNAVDEGGAVIKVIDGSDFMDVFEGRAGHTRIFIELVDELFDVVNHWNAYFTNERKDIIEGIEKTTVDWETIHECKVYHKYDDKFRIYRKGVLVYFSEDKAVFDYDLAEADINEERILANIYDAKRKLGISIGAQGSSFLLRKMVKGMDKFQRNKFPHAESEMYLSYQVDKNKKNWKDALEGLSIINRDRLSSYEKEAQADDSIILDSSLSYALSEIEGISRVMGVPSKGLAHSFRETNPTMEQKQLLDKAYEFMVVAGFNFGDVQIQTVNFDDYAISGMADIAGRRIFVGQNCFDKGLKYMVTCLMEELAHIESRMFDETRAFQNFLIDKWLCAIEERLDIRL